MEKLLMFHRVDIKNRKACTGNNVLRWHGMWKKE